MIQQFCLMRDTLHDNINCASISSIHGLCVLDHIYGRASKNNKIATNGVWMIAQSDEQHMSKI